MAVAPGHEPLLPSVGEAQVGHPLFQVGHNLTSLGQQRLVVGDVPQLDGEGGEERFHDRLLGKVGGIRYSLVSGDYLVFKPKLILE